ncbi:MAG: (Fe-S)-binding protein [Acidobacteriota bacterium]|nr:(Fe-S)-binding protein [Acidobacteriota bacterium]MDH3522653.1 (Fe-S)-binding protein [Acidobacteriota bacterium]
MPELASLRKRTQAALCLACGKCSTMCPLSPSGWFSAARLAAIREPETEIAGQTRSLDACLTCGACEQRCPEGVRFVEFVRGVRALAPPVGRRACPHGEMLQAAARLMAGPTAPTRDLGWIGDELEIAETGEVALFVGCLPFFDLLFTDELGIATVDIARAAIRLLNGLGIRPVVLAEERCCGHDLLWNGEPEAFQALAAANAAAFEARGVKKVLTTCAECCSTWRRDYREAAPGYRPEVEHLAEFLAARLAAGELAARDGAAPSTTFQDPCRLGRHLGVTEAPRSVLAALAGGAAPLEMERSGRDADCCGTSGFIHCDANSRRLQSERLAAAAATGAETLVTACPKCLIHFQCAQCEDRRRQRAGNGIAVEDLTVLAARMLVPASTARPTGDA